MNKRGGLEGREYPFLEDTYPTIGLGGVDDLTVHRAYSQVRQYGIEMRFYALPGKIGRFNFFMLVTELLQGVVLLSVATELTKYFVWFAFLNDGNGTSQTFRNYQCTPVLVKRAIARSAAKAAVSAHTFLASLDPRVTGVMSRAKLFQTLQYAIGDCDADGDTLAESSNPGRLTDAQVARVVRDICVTAHGIQPDAPAEADDRTHAKEDLKAVYLDEFCHLISDDEADIHDLIDLYCDLPGDEDFLQLLLNETKVEKPKMLERANPTKSSTKRAKKSPSPRSSSRAPDPGSSTGVELGLQDVGDLGALNGEAGPSRVRVRFRVRLRVRFRIGPRRDGP